MDPRSSRHRPDRLPFGRRLPPQRRAPRRRGGAGGVSAAALEDRQGPQRDGVDWIGGLEL